MVMRVVLCEFLLCHWVEYGKLEKKLDVNLSSKYNTMSDSIPGVCVLINLTSPSVKILLLPCDIYNNSLPGTLHQTPSFKLPPRHPPSSSSQSQV